MKKQLSYYLINSFTTNHLVSFLLLHTFLILFLPFGSYFICFSTTTITDALRLHLFPFLVSSSISPATSSFHIPTESYFYSIQNSLNKVLTITNWLHVLFILYDSCRYRAEPRLTLNGSKHFKVRMGFGLHAGWAIEGAVGEQFLITTSYCRNVFIWFLE